MQVRFAKFVFPGETLQTEMWKSDDGKKIFFQVRVVERDVLAITNAAVELNRSVTTSSASAAPSSGPKASGALPAVPGFKASPLFQQIHAGLSSASEASRTSQVKKTNAVFQFEIINAEKKKQGWFIDLKNGLGDVGLGSAPKADVTIMVADSDFVDLASGKLNGQKAFMSGKLKVKGQMMLATVCA